MTKNEKIDEKKKKFFPKKKLSKKNFTKKSIQNHQKIKTN